MWTTISEIKKTHQRLWNILLMIDGMYMSFGRISRRGRSCLVSAGAYVTDTRMDEAGVSYDDMWGTSYWVPYVPTPGSRVIWLISWEYDVKSLWNKSNSSVDGSGARSGGSWVGRSAVEISMSLESVRKYVQINYTYLNEGDQLKILKKKWFLGAGRREEGRGKENVVGDFCAK
jgi:hypothetical protein